MADFAGNFTFASVIQWKLMQFQLRRNPLTRCMTVLALNAKEAFVDLRFGMTQNTLFWSVLEYFVRMAGFTINFSMAPIQREDKFVIKINHPVNTVMTIQTSLTKLVDMVLHK